MGKILCRADCGALRSTTVTSTEGEHVPDCHYCSDKAYLIRFDTSIYKAFSQLRLKEEHKTLTDGGKLLLEHFSTHIDRGDAVCKCEKIG